MADTSPVLMQFAYSHYNEKARWSLDWKRVPHQRETLLPGPHLLKLRRVAKDTTVPVLRVGEEVIQGSDRIIDALETRHPEPALYPADPADRRRALELQARFDSGLGIDARRGIFSVILDEPDYLVSLFGHDLKGVKRAAYRASVPAMAPLFRARMDLTPAQVDASLARVEKELDFIATEAKGGYLVGSAFTVADLSAAALLSICIDPPDCCMTKPQPMPEAMQAWVGRWAGHSGIEWALRMYREHRPPSQQIS